ncbi:hypothetical protein P5673_021685, partial [Acropora cervicornis]
MNRFIDDIGTSLLCLNPPEDLDAHCHLCLTSMHRYNLNPSLSDPALLGLTMTSRMVNVKRGKPNGIEDSDLSLFKSKRNRMLVLINNSRQEYYSNLVAENCHDQAKLFRVRTITVHYYDALLNLNLREPWGIAHFPQPRPPYGIRYHSQLGMLICLSSHLRRNLRPIYSPEFIT